MKNFEKYKKEIKVITNFNGHFGMRNGKLVDCLDMLCSECDWQKNGCIHNKWDWLYEDEECLLTDEEREYLKSVIKPFEDNVIDVLRDDHSNDINDNKLYYLHIRCNGKAYDATIPINQDDFKGMEIRRVYSLGKLGL